MEEKKSIRACNYIKSLLQHPVLFSYRTLFTLWLLLPVIATLLKLSKHNNFLIFRSVFYHTIDLLPLYIPYPGEYWDQNYYGPVFSLLIAPFALLPTKIGLLFWTIALSLCLYAAVRRLPLPQKQHIFIYWFCAHELLTALFMSQFNIAIAAIIISTFYCIERGHEGRASFLIMLGTMVKIYGVVGFAFFFFSKHKIRFIVYAIIWGLVMFLAPMLISNTNYTISQYAEWLHSLASKNELNLFASHQNISLLGMVRKITQSASYSDWWLIAGGMLLFALPYLRIRQYQHIAFRYTLLASVLLFVVLFSTGSESSSYIIAFVGISIWYLAAPWRRSTLDIGLLFFAMILTSFSPSDLFPAALRRELVQPYALKALPCALIWLKLSYEMCFRCYKTKPHYVNEYQQT